jgi:hypothetical protein
VWWGVGRSQRLALVVVVVGSGAFWGNDLLFCGALRGRGGWVTYARQWKGCGFLSGNVVAVSASGI